MILRVIKFTASSKAFELKNGTNQYHLKTIRQLQDGWIQAVVFRLTTGQFHPGCRWIVTSVQVGREALIEQLNTAELVNGIDSHKLPPTALAV